MPYYLCYICYKCVHRSIVIWVCRNQSQVTLLSPNQAVLYTWDDPASERTLMWNVCGGKKPSFPACITKVNILSILFPMSVFVVNIYGQCN